MTLAASIKGASKLATFQVANDGALLLINEIETGAGASYVAWSPKGDFIVSAYYSVGKVLVHRVGVSGRIDAEVQSITTDAKAHAAVRDPSGRFWFIPHTGPNAIFQFRCDESSGLLSPNDPAKLIRSAPAGPRHLWFHPQLQVAYSSDEQGRSVSAYAFDANNGTLALTQTLSTLPAGTDLSKKGSTSDIEVHSSGKFVYIANRGHDSLARYEVDQDTGQLKYLGNTVTETTTRSFNIGPKGNFLIAAGQKSGKAAVFKIDPATGDLDRISTQEVGKNPWWVLIR
jgi:6-phosphogluconolactonase